MGNGGSGVKKILAAMTFFIVLHGGVYAEGTGEKAHTDGVAKLTETMRQKDSAFACAYDAYFTAKTIDDAQKKSEAYAEAIRKINAAVMQDEDDVDALFLASQIYRGKGGVAYAKNYFKRAEGVILEDLEKYPGKIDAHLYCAVLYYAGDVRFWEDYKVYRDKAVFHAKTVLKLCEKVEGDKKELPRLYSVKAMAHLILDDREKCLKYLKKYASFFPANEVYLNIFEEMVMRNTWYWKVSAESISKEFLLYLFTGSAVETGAHKFSC